MQGRRCRAVDSAILADAVAAQGTVTQLVSATEWALTAAVPGLATEIRRHQMPRWHEPAAGVHAVTPDGYSASRRDYDGRRVVSPVIAGLQAGPGRAVRPWHGWLGCHCNGGKPEEAIGR